MSNLVINIRFGLWHLQVVRLGDWSIDGFLGRTGRRPISLSKNERHKDNPIRFQVHQFFGYCDRRGIKGR